MLEILENPLLYERSIKALDNLKDIKKEIDQLYVDHNNKILSYESIHEDLEKEAKSLKIYKEAGKLSDEQEEYLNYLLIYY